MRFAKFAKFTNAVGLRAPKWYSEQDPLYLPQDPLNLENIVALPCRCGWICSGKVIGGHRSDNEEA